MDNQWVPIRYRDFYDFPRAFVVERGRELLFFDCPFNDDQDEYGSEFIVYKIGDALRDRIETVPWTDLVEHSERIGVVPTQTVQFDETKRRMINTSVFARVGQTANEP